MTSDTTQIRLTARTLLLGAGTDDDLASLRHTLSERGVLSQCGGELTRLTPEARQAVDDTLASVTAGLLDIDLGDALIYCWRTHDRLVKAAEETMRVPGRQEVVQLASHEVTWTTQPTIDLLVDGVRVHTFRFQLSLVFEVDVAAAVVKEGKLAGLKAGDGSVAGTLTLEMPGEDLELLRQERRINLHIIIHLGSGIPLLRTEPNPPAPAEEPHQQRPPNGPRSDSRP